MSTGVSPTFVSSPLALSTCEHIHLTYSQHLPRSGEDVSTLHRVATICHRARVEAALQAENLAAQFTQHETIAYQRHYADDQAEL